MKCHGKTQKHTRCRRKAAAGSQFCYQHHTSSTSAKSKTARPIHEVIAGLYRLSCYNLVAFLRRKGVSVDRPVSKSQLVAMVLALVQFKPAKDETCDPAQGGSIHMEPAPVVSLHRPTAKPAVQPQIAKFTHVTPMSAHGPSALEYVIAPRAPRSGSSTGTGTQ